MQLPIRMFMCLTLLTIMCIGGSAQSPLQGNPPARVIAAGNPLVLQGIHDLAVVVYAPPKELAAFGLDQTTLQTDVELKLRLAGINVLSSKENERTPGFPHLTVTIEAMRMDAPIQDVFMFNLKVRLRENLLSVRMPRSTILSIPTWEDGSSGVIGVNKIPQLRENVKDRIDKFLNDYLTANPKK